jgi:membrane protease YdiL (CAAX protease family)
LHVVTGVASPDNIVAGVFLSWAFLKSGSLVAPVTLHALGNTFILVTQLAVWFWKG